MDETAAGLFGFAYAYGAINLIRQIQWGGADPDTVRILIADATREAKRLFPAYQAGIDTAAESYEAAIRRGLALREEYSTVVGTPTT